MAPGPGLVAKLTWILPGTPVLSIRLATLTVFPQMSYCGRRAPITPATTGPTLMPGSEGRMASARRCQGRHRPWPEGGPGATTCPHRSRFQKEQRLLPSFLDGTLWLFGEWAQI